MWAGADIKKTTEGGEQQRCMNENPIFRFENTKKYKIQNWWMVSSSFISKSMDSIFHLQKKKLREGKKSH